MTELAWWWPTEEQINKVLISDADAHSPAVALAVHQRMHILRRHYKEPIDTRSAEPVDESALLARLVEPVGDGCQVTLIEGKSGTGKSHLVRWLEIQLERRVDRETRVVLFVSKGSRLRDIVKRLCDRPELTDQTELRQQLSVAQEPIEPEDAAGRLCDRLAYVCQQRERAASAKHERGELLTDLERLQRKWGHHTQLPHILVYLPLRPSLIGPAGGMLRLVQHLHTKTGPLDTRSEPEFVERDLEFEDLPQGLDNTALVVLRNLEDLDARSEAVRVLNDALDDAKGILLGLHPGVVREVFASIRQSLLTREKELVLLVEDFADLSGLQREVLQASIDTGMTGGAKTQCTLRTVLAFTDGFISVEQTVLSRAQHVYYVPSNLGDDHVLEQSIRLVASYLRAARIGSSELECAMANATGDDNWLPAPPEATTENSDILNSFGESDGIALFPFSARVLERLVRDHYEGMQTLLFLPRDIIKEIVPRVLKHRAAFERGEFPSEAFQAHRDAQLTTEQSEWLRRTGATGAMRKRLERFVLYWGLNAGAARAFGLPVPDVSEAPESVRARRSSSVPLKIASGEVVVPITTQQQFVALFAQERTTLDSWRTVDVAGLLERRKIRNAIDESLRPAFAWAWLPRIDRFFKKRWGKWQEAIDIAGLRLADDVNKRITLVTDEERADKATNEYVARQLTAVLGAPSLKSWDVEGIETHLAAHLSFVEHHHATVEQHLLSTWHSRQWDVLPFLVRAVAMTSAVLGVANSDSSDGAAFIDALFAESPPDSDTAWSRECLAPLRELRGRLCELLAREVGAFQGTGKNLHGIDAARLHPLFPSPKGEVAPLPSVPDFPPGANDDEDIRTIREANALLKALELRSKIEIDARRAAAERVQELLGQEIDKDVLLAALDSLIAELKHVHSVTNEDAIDVKKAITALRKERVIEALRAAERIVARDASLWERLVSLGRNERDASPLARTDVILQQLNTFLTEQERIVLGTESVDPLDEAEKAHIAQLMKVRAFLDGTSSTEVQDEEAS